MEKTPPQTERQEASYSREFLPNGGLAPLFSALLGGIPRKEWAKQEVTSGGMRRNTSFSIGGMWRKLRMQRRGLRIVHFLGIPLLF